MLEPGDWVIVYAGTKRADLVRVADVDLLSRVRRCFGLPDSLAALTDVSAPSLYSPTEPLPHDLGRPASGRPKKLVPFLSNRRR